MVSHSFSPTAFGDPFDIAQLPLPRPAGGYAVQLLDTDQLLDCNKLEFFPVRHIGLQALFARFYDAFSAAQMWAIRHGISEDEHRLAIVPVGFDPDRQRPILIYGVLETHP